MQRVWVGLSLVVAVGLTACGDDAKQKKPRSLDPFDIEHLVEVNIEIGVDDTVPFVPGHTREGAIGNNTGRQNNTPVRPIFFDIRFKNLVCFFSIGCIELDTCRRSPGVINGVSNFFDGSGIVVKVERQGEPHF